MSNRPHQQVGDEPHQNHTGQHQVDRLVQLVAGHALGNARVLLVGDEQCFDADVHRLGRVLANYRAENSRLLISPALFAT